MRSLKHENVVRCYGIIDGGEGGDLMLIQEFCPGGTLQDKVQKPTYTAAQALGWLVDMAKGMEYLHGFMAAGGSATSSVIAHRDLKPENVIFSLRSSPPPLISPLHSSAPSTHQTPPSSSHPPASCLPSRIQRSSPPQLPPSSPPQNHRAPVPNLSLFPPPSPSPVQSSNGSPSHSHPCQSCSVASLPVPATPTAAGRLPRLPRHHPFTPAPSSATAPSRYCSTRQV